MPTGPRYDKAETLLRLALDMTSSAEGLSLQDIQSGYGVGRRTAERMRDAIVQLIPATEEVDTGERVKCWRIPSRDATILAEVTASELAALETVARLGARHGLDRQAVQVRDLGRKLQVRLPAPELRRAQPDLEAMLESEGFAQRPGPRPAVPLGILEGLRTALLGPFEVLATYRSRTTGATSVQRLQPYGLLYGNRHYLVAYSPDVARHFELEDGFRLFALDGISALEVTPRGFARDPGFRLDAYAARSFGVFQESPRTFELMFSAGVAEEVLRYHFHPSQKVSRMRGGRMRVTFRAGGLTEVCWHLFTQGNDVEVVRPVQLKDLYQRMLRDARASLR